MKAILNHAFLIGFKEFVPSYDGDKGGNVIHQIDSVYYFPNKDNASFRMAISISLNKNEMDKSIISTVHMTGVMHDKQIVEYDHDIDLIPSKDEFVDVKIYKWTDYIDFSFNRSGLVKFTFTFKDTAGEYIDIEGSASTYFVLGVSPLKKSVSLFRKMKLKVGTLGFRLNKP